MGLFTKKDPCAICGEKVKGLLPWKVEGQYVCNDCYGVVDIQGDANKMTMQEFLQYRAFREENQKLAEQFTISEKVDFGAFDTKIIFDFDKQLFCMSKRPDKTIFHGSELKSFVIKEDSFPLIEGSASGLVRHESGVQDQVRTYMPMITQFQMEKEMRRQREQMESYKNESERVELSPLRLELPKPFDKFQVELYFEHPYWNTITCDKSAPSFRDDAPDIGRYLRDYDEGVNCMETLARSLMRVAFPDAAVAGPADAGEAEQMQTAHPTDVADELRKYKALFDDGILTQDEFEAKKKQLLNL